MSTPPRPDPGTVSHEHVAAAARRRAAQLADDLVLRDAKIAEQAQYIERLEEALNADGAPPA